MTSTSAKCYTRRISKEQHNRYVATYLKKHPEQMEKQKARAREYSRRSRERNNFLKRKRNLKAKMEKEIKRIFTIRGMYSPPTPIN